MSATMPAKLPRLTALALAGVAYFGLAAFGMRLVSLTPDNITLLWLPSGIALLMCLQWGYRAALVVAVASYLANLPGMSAGHGLSVHLHTMVSAGADALSGVLASWLLRRFLPGGLRRTGDLLTFAALVCVAPTILTSAIITLNLAWGQFVAWHDAPNLFRMLLLADSLGILLVYPIYQGWHDAAGRRIDPAEWGWIARILPLAALMLALDMTGMEGTVYFILPLLLLLAFNARLFGVASASTLTLIAIIVATAQHKGAFVRADAIDTDFRLLAFVFSTALTTLGIALQNKERLNHEAASRHWNDIAERDALTGLFNRRGLLQRVAQEHARSERTPALPYSIAMLDVDHFKGVNDRFGHHTGDAVLRHIAQYLADDSRDNDAIGRWGGEEFALLMPACSSEDARAPLERVRKRIAATPFVVNGVAVHVTVSIGVATYAGPNLDANEDSVIQRADEALYSAKRQGRDRVVSAG